MNKKMHYTLPAPGVDVAAPLIYMWEIADSSGQIVGRYIGKANGGEKRPRQHYRRNVEKLLRGEPYKKGKDYRRAHFALAQAVTAGHAISLHYLCNVAEDQNIFEVEMRYIREHGCNVRDGVGLNGPGNGSVPKASIPASSAAVSPHDVSGEHSTPDLEDFLEFVEDNYSGRFDVRAGSGRYSLWIGGERLIRAKQSGVRGNVRIKLVRAVDQKKAVEFSWDGTEKQLSGAIEEHLRRFGYESA